MIQTELLTGGLIRTYSDAGLYIRGGEPEGDYAEAIDPVSAGRTYTETNRRIDEDDQGADPDEATVEDYQTALERLGVEI